ncbi:non-ribosomal peptide synthetase [Dinoroseobacter sp. S76]|uniref:non-ribosomal peptide synthetase n=1 Tax=Dinoroseobacter sp. S76 TaxID=3415124 RepID=UPI003C7D7DC5
MKDTDTTAIRTIAELLSFQAGSRPEAPALIAPEGGTLSYGALEQEVLRLAGALAGATGTPATSTPTRYGIVFPNGIDMAVLLLAMTTHGVAVPFNPTMTFPEFVAQFSATQIDALVLPRDAQEDAVKAAQHLSLPIVWVSADRQIATEEAAHPSLRPALPSQTALILMTSGSTGKPKIVPLSQRNVCCSAFDVARSVDLTPEDKCLVMWEQFHIGGLVDLLLAPLAAGSSLVVAGSFEAQQFFTLQRAHEATWFQGVPTTLAELELHASRQDLTSPLMGLRFLRCVAAALSPAQQEKLEARFHVPIVRTLGMTEAGPLITSTQLPPAADKPGSVGQSAGPDVAILSPEGEALAPGQTGQIAVRGENVFDGYEENDAANDAAFVGDWFLTGDLGYFDEDGFLFLTGRAKELINRGGEKISPNEVDDVLTAHPGVRQAASFALPHTRLGEDIHCAVTRAPDGDIADLRAFLATRLAPHKIPRQIIVLDDLPKTPVGKIDRQRLAALAAESNNDKPQDARGPETPLEKLIAEIWMRELSLESLNVDDEFASLDGDSLSAVRIMVALETALDASMPDDVVENFTTVREIAERLAEHGLEPQGAQDNAGADQITQAVLSEQIVFSGDFEDARKLISEVKGRSDLKLKLDFIVTHLAPAEVLPHVERLEALDLDETHKSLGFLERFRMKSEFTERLKNTRKYLDLSPNISRWQRKELLPSALFYGDPTIPAETKTLIVGFTGNRMRLSMPTYRFLAGMDVERSDLLTFLDHSQRLFFHGVPGIGDDLSAIADFVTGFVRDHGYQRVIGVGVSGGSLAILHVGFGANFDAAVSVDPASLTKHPEWHPEFARLGATHDPDKLRIKIIYGRRRRHKHHADMVGELIPHAERIRYPHAGKNILPEAQDRGEFVSLWKTWTS